MVVWGGLTNSWEKKRSKKGEKERYTHLNAEFQRIARRDKKAFLSNQCKEIEENNRMGKTRDLFKKTGDTKGTFHAKMGSIKDRNGMDLTEADGWMASPTQWTWVWVNSRSWWWTGRPGVLWFMGSQRVGHNWATELNWTEQKQKILRTGGKNTQKNCTNKDLHDSDNDDGMVTHLEPDILEWEVRWVLESITMNKASGGDGIPAELLQILKDDAVKMLYSICQHIWETQQWPQDCKRSVFILIPKKSNAKECSNYHTIALISHASKEMLKILQASPSTAHEPWTSRCSSWI